ncbi:MAG: exo-alpha-sialidase [Planctomycetota bacterium]|nr:exo-alpha-sialidase [Planctomycetota bacterium]
MSIEQRSSVSLSLHSRPPNISHASTLCFAGEKLYCAWFAGPFEGSRNTCILAAIRENGHWSPSHPIAKTGAEPHWNPVLHYFDDTLWLFYKLGIYPKRWKTRVTQKNNGAPWNAPRDLVPGDIGGRGPVKNKILVLSNGDWLAPASLESDSGWSCFVDLSPDNGQSWIAQAQIYAEQGASSGAGIIQPSLWESHPGHVHMLTRSDLGSIYRADSKDFGRSWSSAYPINLPNNNSGLDLTLLNDRLVLACNPNSDPHGPRSPLTLFDSRDHGQSWNELYVLEDGPGEFSYPAIIPCENGVIVSYTENREAIRVREFKILP